MSALSCASEGGDVIDEGGVELGLVHSGLVLLEASKVRPAIDVTPSAPSTRRRSRREMSELGGVCELGDL